MSLGRTILTALAVMAALVATPTFANESDNAVGDPLATPMAVTRGAMGAGGAGESQSAMGSPFARRMATTRRHLPVFEETLALTNNAPASDADGISHDGHPLSRHLRHEGRHAPP
ncbi:hypothetical protein [Roseomonas sp. USHLN139]|uniref:hypothetical protein n=1 Tax=Roseomonas sp. USHLN139 TaxID=3081298 RepID=UPI003B015B00